MVRSVDPHAGTQAVAHRAKLSQLEHKGPGKNNGIISLDSGLYIRIPYAPII